MSYTRRQYSLMAVLAVGLAALAFDYLFMRPGDLPPQQAQAQTAQENTSRAGGAAGIEAPRYALASKLNEYARLNPAPQGTPANAFQPSPDWLAELRKKPVELDGTQAVAQGFMDRHRLSSLICTPTQSSAIIDERVMREGDSLDGFTLESIKPTSVAFSRQGINIVLTVREESSK
jgi:hypothetical protein